MSADAQIVEYWSQTIATTHPKGECFSQLYKKYAGQSETNSQQT